jgi:hypothetical protein
MGIVSCRGPFAACLIAAAASLPSVGWRLCVADEGPSKTLVGSWEREGQVNVFSADGTGKNHDGSRFRWEWKEGRLIAQARAEDGGLGEEWSVPIAFTRDGKEFSYLLGGKDGGLERITFHKLDEEGRRFEDRTDEGRAYPPGSEALKGEGPPAGDAPTLSPGCP